MWREILNGIVQAWLWIWHHIFYINIFFSVLVVFFQRKDPKSIWSWLLVLNCIPVAGFLLYLLIGWDLYKSKMFKLKEIEDTLNAAIGKQEEILKRKELPIEDERLSGYEDMIMYNLRSGGAVYTDGNAVEIYTDGHKKFEALVEEIKKAKSYIHLQYYIIKPDGLFWKLEEELAKKAAEGVEVRILYDSLGCRKMRKKYWKRLKSEGIQVAEFFPIDLLRLRFRINYRNHRKIVVIDGKTGFVGGYNIGREYLGLDGYFGYWRDTHLKIKGPAVRDLQLRFVLDWNYAAQENLFRDKKYFDMEEERPRSEGKCGIQIITSGPDSRGHSVKNNYIRMIHKAKEHVYIQTPYFVPDEAYLNAIKIAARSGIDVRLMIPCKPDHPFIYWATYSYMEELIAAGVKCYMYDNGFLHAKGMMVDGLVSCYGTANMDIRSFHLNFEVNAILYSREVTQRLEESFLQDLEVCTRITPMLYAKRSLYIRAKEQVSRMLSPLL